MGAVESIRRAPSIAPPEGTCGTFPPDLRNIIGIVRSIVPRDTGKWLERVTGKSQRTTEYWLQGRYKPRHDETVAIVRALRAEIAMRGRALEQFELDLS